MQLHHSQLGAGPPLLVLHGLLGSHQNLLPVARRFAPHFHVFAIDQRNHGHSPHHDDMSYEIMAADVVRFMDRHDLPAAHVLGHSMGGKTAMHLALHHPARVEKLVVVDMSPRAYGPRFASLLRILRELHPARFPTRAAIDQSLAASIPEAALRQFLLKNLMPGEHGGYRWRVNLESIAANYDRLRQAVDSAIPFPGDALFVLGGHSDYVGENDAAEIHRLFPAAQFTTIAGAGHWVHAERPDDLCREVLRFLTPAT